MAGIHEPHFQDADKAREYLEALRWPDGPICPHCGSEDDVYRLKGKGGAKGTKARPGLLKCRGCRKQFSVTVGTVFHRSKVPLHKWLMATYLICSSKKGISSHQLHRTLGVTYKTAWFMSHRIREAMKATDSEPPMGEDGGVVELDETFLGGSKRRRLGREPSGSSSISADRPIQSTRSWRGTCPVPMWPLPRATQLHFFVDALPMPTDLEGSVFGWLVSLKPPTLHPSQLALPLHRFQELVPAVEVAIADGTPANNVRADVGDLNRRDHMRYGEVGVRSDSRNLQPFQEVPNSNRHCLLCF